jgi:methylenetetrahydrofolate dehydrogenase (NADP+) / methenyltetrahydrofolate cyclohydrolase
MLFNGEELRVRRLEHLKRERLQFGQLRLSIVAVQEDAVTSSYVRIKNKIASELDVTVEQVSRVADATGDGIILQLPLPAGVDQERERNSIPIHTDVDVLSDAAYQAFMHGAFPPPPVARALSSIMDAHQIPYQGAHVVVVGQGRLVGKPAAELFRQRGATVIALEKGDDVVSHTRVADIVILGAGDPHFLKPEMVKEGCVILDAGTSESSGKVVGDADPACMAKASLMTPTPGGVGPLAVIEIFANLFELVRRA